MPNRIALAIFLSLFIASPGLAVEAPQDLSVWQDWVLHGMEEKTCPPVFNTHSDRRCYWPSTLDLDLTDTGGRFDLKVLLFAPSWVGLPGGTGAWPQNVTAGGEIASVALRNGSPALFLAEGEYRVTGDFTWEKQPESIPVPIDSGLVSLTLDGSPLPFPDLKSGRLWLKTKTGEEESAQDRMEIQVYRLMDDRVPFRVVTRLEIDVAGQQREVLMGPVLPEHADGGMFVPVRLTSPLTARLENDGRLRIQVRPGHWQIEVESRSLSWVEALPVPPAGEGWPDEEIWVFGAHTDLRVVEPGGLSPVDPRQTTLPSEWHNMPAFVARQGQRMNLKVIRRGDADPAPDNININREMWLDFDGSGYSVRDRINGTVSRSHRLEATEGLEIGRVTLSGEEMLITRLPDSDRYGVEVRRGDVDLVAASRMEDSVHRFPTSGWDHDFISASARLNVPPGWQVLAVSGVDNRPHTWLQRWSLLDLFLLLIISIAVFRMTGRWAGALALTALALIWHAPFAPTSVWLHILIATALMKHLPEGRLKKGSAWYRLAALGVLILMFVPFAIDQARSAFFPQLEQRGLFSFASMSKSQVPGYHDTGALHSNEDLADQDSDSVSVARMEIPAAEQKMSRKKMDLFSLPSNVMLQQIDEGALVQTGPGMPSWGWKTVSLQWNGPVGRGQQVRIYYLPPLANSVVKIIRILLVALLGLTLAGVPIRLPGRTAARAALLAVFLLPTIPAAQAHAAQFPSPELLKEYQSRLLEPPECMPNCAQVSRMKLEADRNTLRLRLQIHALADVAVPLPGGSSQWIPDTAVADGNRPLTLSRTADGTLWTFLEEGIHQVVMEGKLPGRSTVQIPLRLPVHRVDSTVRGWTLEGVHENGTADRQLQLTRVRQEKPPGDGKTPLTEAEALPPFVIVNRHLLLGLEWRSSTRIRRVSPPGTAVVLEVPLLEGESVVTDGVRVKDGNVLVNMGPNQHGMTWESALDMTPELHLTAPVNDGWVESWSAVISPIWHMEQTGGITVVHRQNPGGVWAPEWRPWPGEDVKLNITRPKGVDGATFTVDASLYELEPGKTASDARLSFRARSSLGGQHVIGLPHGAEVTAVNIDGLLQPIRPEEDKLTLPVHPGVQSYEIEWRTPEGLNLFYRPPTVDLGTRNVNQHLKVNMPRNRWILFTGGPLLGPGVLFWSVLAVVLLVAFALSRTGLTPLRWWQWMLLGVGLTQVSLFIATVIVGWLLALGLRRRIPEDMEPNRFNAMQAGLTGLTVLAAFALIAAVQKGLLGYPEMQVMGNGSSAYNLLWYSDRVDFNTAGAWILSVPMYVYRVLMLAWALWLASSLISWLKWGWDSFTGGGYWKKMDAIKLPGRKNKDPEGFGEISE